MAYSNINKGISYQTDIKGRKTALVLDLRNKEVKALADDLLDLISIKDRINDVCVDFFEVTDHILAHNKSGV